MYGPMYAGARVCVCGGVVPVYNVSISRIRLKLLIGFLNDITTMSESWKNCCSEASGVLRNQPGSLQANVEKFH